MKKQQRRIPIAILAFFGIIIFFIGIYNHYLFKTFTYDYANYNFAFRDYANFRISPLPTYRGTFLQDHFSFLLMYFIPVYWLLNWLTGTYTLIIIQNALILIAAWYSYKTIKLKTDNPWLTNGVLIYFFLLFGRYSSFGTDVNLAIMSACFIPVFLYYFEIKKYIVAFVLLILSLFSRENIPLWFIFIFIVLIISHWKDKKAVVFSVAGIVVSIVYFILLFKVFIPGIETPGVEYKLFNYSALGADPGEALSYIVRNPINSLKLFFVNHLEIPEYDKVKLEFYWVYFISGGFILLLRPRYLIWFIPIVAQKVLNDDFFRWGLATYYSVEVVTLLPLSVFLVLSSLKFKQLQQVLAGAACVGALSMTVYKMDSSNHQVPWTFYKAKIKFYDKSFYEAPFDVKKVNQLLKQIPGDAKVSASNVIAPHLAQRQFIYFFPNVKDAEYIVFSVFDDNYLLSAEENKKYRERYLSSPNWKVIAKEYPVYLLKKRGNPATEGSEIRQNNRNADTLVCNFETIDSLENNILFSNGQIADDGKHLSKDEFRSDSSSICLSKSEPYSRGIHLENIHFVEKLEISVWMKKPADRAFIVLDNKNGFYRKSNIVAEEEGEWKKISMSLRIPENIERDELIIFLWNAGEEKVYFDDLQIVRKYK